MKKELIPYMFSVLLLFAAVSCSDENTDVNSERNHETTGVTSDSIITSVSFKEQTVSQTDISTVIVTTVSDTETEITTSAAETEKTESDADASAGEVNHDKASITEIINNEDKPVIDINITEDMDNSESSDNEVELPEEIF